MENAEKLYIAKEDLYRLGGGSSPALTRLRPNEINTYEVNGITHIMANGKGVSLFNKEGLESNTLTGWVWTIKQNTAFPLGLKLIKDQKPLGHYTLAPAQNIPLSEYINLLEKMVIYCEKSFRKKA